MNSCILNPFKNEPKSKNKDLDKDFAFCNMLTLAWPEQIMGIKQVARPGQASGLELDDG